MIKRRQYFFIILLLLLIFNNSYEQQQSWGDNSKIGQLMRPNVLNSLSQKQSPYLPRIYASIPTEWGCCRICLHKEVPAQDKKTWKPADPSRPVNCCPLCPWPRRQKRRLGPYTHYFLPKEETEIDHYEKMLKGFRPWLQRDNVDEFWKTANHDYPRGDGEGGGANPQQQQAEQGQENNAEGNSFLQFLAKVLPDPRPYKGAIGHLMNRRENYVYGFPGEPANVDASPKPDAPPCCNICRSEKKRPDLVDDPTCCMQCTHNTVGHWRSYMSRRDIAQSSVLGMPPKTRSSLHGPITHDKIDDGLDTYIDAAPVPNRDKSSRSHIHNIITGQEPEGQIDPKYGVQDVGGFDPHMYRERPWSSVGMN